MVFKLHVSPHNGGRKLESVILTALWQAVTCSLASTVLFVRYELATRRGFVFLRDGSKKSQGKVGADEKIHTCLFTLSHQTQGLNWKHNAFPVIVEKMI